MTKEQIAEEARLRAEFRKAFDKAKDGYEILTVSREIGRRIKAGLDWSDVDALMDQRMEEVRRQV